MSGNLGIIACPMFEDELVFALKNDKDEKSIYVVDTGYTETIVDKLNRNSIAFEMMDKYTLDTEMDLDEGFNVVIIMNPMRLHTEPDKLKKHIEEQADFYCERFDVITLYYAMCGNFGWDMTDWMSRRTKTPFIMFRDEKGKVCDDCIGVAVGGTEEYYNLVRKYSGQLFLTPCTATNWGKYSENREWEGLFDSEDEYMKFLFQMGGYKYALKIDTGLGDRERYDLACQEVARRMELELHEPESNIATTRLATKIWDESKEALKNRAIRDS